MYKSEKFTNRTRVSRKINRKRIRKTDHGTASTPIQADKGSFGWISLSNPTITDSIWISTAWLPQSCSDKSLWKVTLAWGSSNCVYIYRFNCRLCKIHEVRQLWLQSFRLSLLQRWTLTGHSPKWDIHKKSTGALGRLCGCWTWTRTDGQWIWVLAGSDGVGSRWFENVTNVRSQIIRWNFIKYILWPGSSLYVIQMVSIRLHCNYYSPLASSIHPLNSHLTILPFHL